MEIVLEDEKGEEYEAVYIGRRAGVRKRFALDHILDDGDTLLFELVEPKRLKIYVFRVGENALTRVGKRGRVSLSEEDKNVEVSDDEEDSSGATKRSSTRSLKKRRA